MEVGGERKEESPGMMEDEQERGARARANSGAKRQAGT
jgi:hypothetical protein